MLMELQEMNMIETERLTLVPLDIRFAADLFKAWGDFDVIKYTYTPLMESVDDSRDWIEWLIENTDSEFTNNFVLLFKGRAIGIAGFPIREKEPFRCGFYCQIAKQFWGHGFALETSLALKAYILAKHPDAIINADAVSVNLASIRVLEKAGMRKIRTGKKEFRANGLELDLVQFVWNN